MDLFGDIDDISSESDGDNPVDERGVPWDQQKEDLLFETRIEIKIPSINSDLGNELYFVKLPKYLTIEPKPFDLQYYEDEFEDEKVLDEEDRIRLKLKVENTIRWRTRRDEEGNEVKESNARIVKWSDGSMSLHLGNKVFDVYKAPMQGNHNHLFIREDTGLQGQAIFKSKLTFRPHSADCVTHKMTLPLANRCSRTQMIRILPMAGCDPECQRTEMIKKEERLRASTHQESQVIHLRKKLNQQGLSVPYQDPDSEEEEEWARIYSSDSDEGSEEDKAQRLLKAKKLNSDEKVNCPERGKQGVKRKKTEA